MAPVSPHTHGICSSGSTGTPKLILMENPAVWTAEIGKPFVEGWQEVSRPQTVLMATTLYHTNGFATMLNLLAGDTLVTLEKFDAGHGSSTWSNATGSAPSRSRRRCCNGSPTSPAWTTGT